MSPLPFAAPDRDCGSDLNDIAACTGMLPLVGIGLLWAGLLVVFVLLPVVLLTTSIVPFTGSWFERVVLGLEPEPPQTAPADVPAPGTLPPSDAPEPGVPTEPQIAPDGVPPPGVPATPGSEPGTAVEPEPRAPGPLLSATAEPDGTDSTDDTGDEAPEHEGDDSYGPAGDPNWERLAAPEQDTLLRAQEAYPELGLTAAAEERDGEYVDRFGRTFDQMGDPAASAEGRWNDKAARRFRASIRAHLLKSTDFTLIDLTGFTDRAIADIGDYVDSLPAAEQEKIIRIGF